MNRFPIYVLFVFGLLICACAFSLAAYLEFFREPPLPKVKDEHGPANGLMALGCVTLFATGVLGFVLSDDE